MPPVQLEYSNVLRFCRQGSFGKFSPLCQEPWLLSFEQVHHHLCLFHHSYLKKFKLKDLMPWRKIHMYSTLCIMLPSYWNPHDPSGIKSLFDSSHLASHMLFSKPCFSSCTKYNPSALQYSPDHLPPVSLVISNYCCLPRLTYNFINSLVSSNLKFLFCKNCKMIQIPPFQTFAWVVHKELNLNTTCSLTGLFKLDLIAFLSFIMT